MCCSLEILSTVSWHGHWAYFRAVTFKSNLSKIELEKTIGLWVTVSSFKFQAVSVSSFIGFNWDRVSIETQRVSLGFF